MVELLMMLRPRNDDPPSETVLRPARLRPKTQIRDALLFEDSRETGREGVVVEGFESESEALVGLEQFGLTKRKKVSFAHLVDESQSTHLQFLVNAAPFRIVRRVADAKGVGEVVVGEAVVTGRRAERAVGSWEEKVNVACYCRGRLVRTGVQDALSASVWKRRKGRREDEPDGGVRFFEIA
jgi:hypothetical protein